MIKCEIKNGKIEIETKGNLVDIATDSVYIFATLYKSMRKNNRKHANEYMKLVLLGIDKMTDVIDAEY